VPAGVSGAVLSRRRRVGFGLLVLFLNLLLIESLARLVLVGVLAPTCDGPAACLRSLLWPRPLHLYYPELARALREPPDDETIDVLLLGGSVLHAGWSSVAPALTEALAYATRRPVRVHNLATAAHTSRDSLLKYRALRGQRYDLVVFYHGINETRTNNAPPELFRPDYGHYAWYRYVNHAADDPLPPLLVTPAVLIHAWTTLGRRLGLLRLVPPHKPEPDWLAYGHEARSRVPFRRNLDAILALAAEKGEPVLLMTFALFVPESYTAERFDAMQTDFTTHQTPLAIWGDPEAVVKAVAAHNAEVREAAAGDPNAALVDQARLMPPERRYFNDVCHLTVEGSSVFVSNLVPTALDRIARRPGSPMDAVRSGP
jgi:hypothetical protein